MFTEMIGFVIVVLGMIFVIVRRQLAKNKANRENFGDSASQLQAQLEDAADIIIERMEDHINHLERLIEQADERIIALNHKLAQVDALGNRALDMDVKSVKKADISVCREKELKKIEIKPTKINKMVFEMLDHGDTIDGIAKQTGLGKGAILLLEELYKSKKTD